MQNYGAVDRLNAMTIAELRAESEVSFPKARLTNVATPLGMKGRVERQGLLARQFQRARRTEGP